MVRADSLAALLNTHLETAGLTIAEAARRSGLSYRQMHRLCNDKSHYIQPATIDGLGQLGIDRRALVLAAYGRAQEPQPA